MTKKYQIFISSTYVDLIEERQAAVEAILLKGHIPAGMELFAANNKSQWEVIQKWIDDSDIYMLILGGRYGSIDKQTGISYTEMEYNYAIEKNKPFFALVLDDEILDSKDVDIIKDYDLKNEKYLSFKNRVRSKMCEFPKSIDQIKLYTNLSLDNVIQENESNLVGWIKGSVQNMQLAKATQQKAIPVTEIEDEPLSFLHEHSTVFAASRFARAFPGDRGIKWYEAEEAVKRLSLFLRQPLEFQTPEEEDFDFEHSPVGDPLWFFRDHSALAIEEFETLSKTKVLMGDEELEIKKIAVNIDPLYYKSYIYVEAKAEEPVGLRKYTKSDLKPQVDTFGYASEHYALIGEHVISTEESDDGAAFINGEIIEVNNPEYRERYLTDYNFIICAKQSLYNSDKFENETADLFNAILTGEQTPDSLFEFLSTFRK